MRYSLGVLCGIGAGLIFGFATGVISTEDKFRKEYRESAESYRRAMELAREVPETVETPVAEEQELDLTSDVIRSDEVAEDLLEHQPKPFKPEIVNPYHKAVAAKETPVEMFVEGGVNDYGVSYIEEEEYQEEDGNEKVQISLIIAGDNAIFVENGSQINDWDEKLGDSILVDFYKHVPEGLPEEVLYVRNHKTNTDYEVVRDQP